MAGRPRNRPKPGPRPGGLLTLLSALGAPGVRALGDCYLNHTIHCLSGAIWGLENLVPHFGYLDGGFPAVEYAQNFYDTDQRPSAGSSAPSPSSARHPGRQEDFPRRPRRGPRIHRLLPRARW
ncbi:MAG: hypothetical protein R2882_11565 [Gemmatimonadales bacterium]